MDLSLRTRTSEHVVIFWDKAQNTELKRLFPFSIDSLEMALDLFEESLKYNASSFGKVIYYKGQYIGDIWCYGIDETDEKMAMLSIVIFEKELWSKGIATVVTNNFIQTVFSIYKIRKIGAFTYSFNNASIRMLEKTGFSEVEEFIENGVKSKYFEKQRTSTL